MFVVCGVTPTPGSCTPFGPWPAVLGGDNCPMLELERDSARTGKGLPVGYRLEWDPDASVLRARDGRTVAAFSARRATEEAVWDAAQENSSARGYANVD